MVPLLVLTAAARLVNLGGAPQRIDDEGTYVAQAWAVQTLGELGHYTYWYDHPPLGWIQIAGWTWATGAFDRYDTSVLAGREAMAVAATVAAGLLWLLARRLGLGRPAAAGAVALFAFSPLALQFTRTVYLDNVATPWLLASFVFALSRRHQLAAFTGAATCFAVAVLSKETYLLMLPFLVWQVWRTSDSRTRRYTLSVAGAVLTLVGSGYVLFALIKGEVLPGPEQVSLTEGLAYQLVTRDDSGSVVDAQSQAGQSVRGWIELDPVLALAGPAAAVAGLGMRRLRPYAAALLATVLVVFKPGYLPVPFVIVMVPFASLLVAAVVEAGLRRNRRTALAAGAGAVVVAVAAGALWPKQLNLLWTADLDRPLRQAQAWSATHVDEDEQILVDDAAWLDLVRAGLPRQNVVWYYKADTDPEVSRRTPNGWADYEYALVTQGVRQSTGTSPLLDNALENGVRVAEFGEGPEAIQIVRILPTGTDAFYAAAFDDAQARKAAGRELLENRSLSFPAEPAAALREGSVDSRLVALLARLSAGYELEIGGFPVVAGEEGTDFPRRTMTLTEVDDPGTGPAAEARQALVTDLREQGEPFAGLEVDRTPAALVVRFPVTAPDYLLPGPPQE